MRCAVVYSHSLHTDVSEIRPFSAPQGDNRRKSVAVHFADRPFAHKFGFLVQCAITAAALCVLTAIAAAALCVLTAITAEALCVLTDCTGPRLSDRCSSG